jgi:hypothetical protein
LHACRSTLEDPLIFMRDVKSRIYFEQMKGRGTRTLSPTELNAVTPDAKHKTHFIIVDAVGVCESDKTDSRPLERKPGVPFDKLLFSIALGNRDTDSITSLAGRLAKLAGEIGKEDRKEIEDAAKQPLNTIISNLLDATDPDKAIEKAKEIFQIEDPTEEQIHAAKKKLIDEACEPFDKPELRNLLIEIKKRNEQIIDTISRDGIIFAGFDEQAKERARGIIDTFKKFIEDNKNELTALQMIYNQPYGRRHITYQEIKQLAEAIQKPPYNLTTELLWQAYEQLEQSRVKKAGPQRLLTDIISLLRFALGKENKLVPFAEIVNERFEKWIKQQEQQSKKFTPEQMNWLTKIKDHIASSLAIEKDDFELSPFIEKGGLIKAYKLFGNELDKILEELNEVLAA